MSYNLNDMLFQYELKNLMCELLYVKYSLGILLVYFLITRYCREN